MPTKVEGTGLLYPDEIKKISVSPTPGQSGAKGAYLQITAATTSDIFIIKTDLRQILASNLCLVDIATGAGGSEVVKIPDLRLETVNLTIAIMPVRHTFPFGVFVPAGTRIAARASNSTADATAVLVDFYYIEV